MYPATHRKSLYMHSHAQNQIKAMCKLGYLLRHLVSTPGWDRYFFSGRPSQSPNQLMSGLFPWEKTIEA